MNSQIKRKRAGKWRDRGEGKRSFIKQLLVMACSGLAGSGLAGSGRGLGVKVYVCVDHRQPLLHKMRLVHYVVQVSVGMRGTHYWCVLFD